MRKIKIVLQRYGIEIEVATSVDVQVGNFVVINAPEGYESNGKFMTAEVISISENVGALEEKFVQKIETNYYDQMFLAKADKDRMKSVLDKIWNDKTPDEKLEILSATEPLIEETVTESVDEEEVLAEGDGPVEESEGTE